MPELLSLVRLLGLGDATRTLTLTSALVTPPQP